MRKDLSAVVIAYYDKHANEYAELTVKVDMTKTNDMFLRYLSPGAAALDAGDGDAANVNVANDQISVLDAGCGSGRDSLFF